DRFGDAADPRVCEHVARSSMLLPGSSQELRRATTLIDRALAAEREHRTWAYPYFLFAKGLAEYRAGRYEAAASIMDADAGRVLGPAPQLVLALSRSALGQTGLARQALARAALSFDWSPARAGGTDAWMFHVLRRE